MHRLLLLLSVSLAVFPLAAASAEEAPRALPAPAVDDPAGGAGTGTAILAGGCYWGMQGLFEHVKGVRKVVAGYSGVHNADGGYGMVSSDSTPAAESIEITYDPSQISYGQLLQIYFSVAHDPTQQDQQGPDKGARYRSDIFTASREQENIAQAYLDQLTKARAFDAPIVTRIDHYTNFKRAEGAEQDYMIHYPNTVYVRTFDLPRLEALKTLFPNRYRETPVTLASE